MGFLICACLLHLLLSTADSGVAAQSQPLSPARILDATLQDYAFRAFEHPRTGIALSAVRLRSGSLRRKGFADYFQFGVPTGVVVQPHVDRVVLVYHNLGSSSDHYYPLSGHTYLAPVLGLLAYDAANLSSVGLQELNIVASRMLGTRRRNDADHAAGELTANTKLTQTQRTRSRFGAVKLGSFSMVYCYAYITDYKERNLALSIRPNTIKTF